MREPDEKEEECAGERGTEEEKERKRDREGRPSLEDHWIINYKWSRRRRQRRRLLPTLSWSGHQLKRVVARLLASYYFSATIGSLSPTPAPIRAGLCDFRNPSETIIPDNAGETIPTSRRRERAALRGTELVCRILFGSPDELLKGRVTLYVGGRGRLNSAFEERW